MDCPFAWCPWAFIDRRARKKSNKASEQEEINSGQEGYNQASSTATGRSTSAAPRSRRPIVQQSNDEEGEDEDDEGTYIEFRFKSIGGRTDMSIRSRPISEHPQAGTVAWKQASDLWKHDREREILYNERFSIQPSPMFTYQAPKRARMASLAGMPPRDDSDGPAGREVNQEVEIREEGEMEMEWDGSSYRGRGAGEATKKE